MRDWSKIAKDVVFTGTDEDGNRYLSEFLRDYKQTFDAPNIEAGCARCLNDYYLKLTSTLHKMTKVKNSGYRLKAKYNGIPLNFGSQIQVFNSNLSDELAEELLEKHPAGAELFDQLPAKKEETGDAGNTEGGDQGDATGKTGDQGTGEGTETGSGNQDADKVEPVTAKSLEKDHTRPELDAKAFELGLDPESFKNKKEAAQAIFDVLNADVTGDDAQE